MSQGLGLTKTIPGFRPTGNAPRYSISFGNCSVSRLLLPTQLYRLLPCSRPDEIVESLRARHQLKLYFSLFIKVFTDLTANTGVK